MPVLKRTAAVLAFCGAMFGAPITTQAEQCVLKSFSVNDYGMDGPKRDSLALLDKYVRDWADKEGIKHYAMGKKTVECKLFLDVGFFDEYTCRAAARVCWNGPKRTAH